MLEPILEKLSTIASGATTIGSTGRAPDDDRKHRLLKGTVIDFIVDKVNSKWFHYHRNRFATSWKNNSKIFDIETVKQG
jgi:hypothetical protein